MENKQRRILELARLFRVLESNEPKAVKIEQIKMVRDNGDITADEAAELAIEYA